MNPRSWLFVPGDSERKQAKAAEGVADALILDLEDSVAPQRRGAARALVAAHLRARRAAQQLWVRVNGFQSGLLLEDLAAVMPGAPHGIVLPKRSGAPGSAPLLIGARATRGLAPALDPGAGDRDRDATGAADCP